MLDKVKFMETLRSVAEVAKISDSPLTKEEIIEYFDDMELTDEQLTMVFQYLQTQAEENDVKQESSQENEKAQVEESMFLKMYLDDIHLLPTPNNHEIQALYLKLIDGDLSVTQEITDYWLAKVVELAKAYSSYPVIMEDVIQEGNIGLLCGIKALAGIKKVMDVDEFLKESVQQAIENYIDEVSTDDDWENTIIAKTTLINEARKALAEENAELPTTLQLSEYTKISEQEIEDILRLLKD